MAIERLNRLATISHATIFPDRHRSRVESEQNKAFEIGASDLQPK